MIFKETKLPKVFEIVPELREDERGHLARIFCENELVGRGIDFHIRQINRSFNKSRGTLRGFHFQKHPKWEAKIMQVLSGAFYTVVTDLRPESKTFKQWIAVPLTAEKKNMLHVPVGCANAFLTLAEDSEMLYLMSEFYSPEHASGFNYADSDINVAWPFEPKIVSPKDAALPPLSEITL